MGFGWLFLGYVVSFLLSGVGAMLNMKFLVCLLGYVMILRGLWELRKYNAAFRFPLWTVFALMPATVYEMLTEWGKVFAWNAPFLSETAETVMAWVDFGITMLFHFTCYYAVAIIAKSVDLPRTVRRRCSTRSWVSDMRRSIRCRGCSFRNRLRRSSAYR